MKITMNVNINVKLVMHRSIDMNMKVNVKKNAKMKMIECNAANGNEMLSLCWPPRQPNQSRGGRRGRHSTKPS
jgi:hypothetical protein